MSIQMIKDIHGNDEYVLLPISVYEALRDQIEDELAGLEAWADQESDYVEFDPADYVENPVALARIKAQVKQVDLAKFMEVTQSYISRLETSKNVTKEALKKVQKALQQMRQLNV